MTENDYARPPRALPALHGDLVAQARHEGLIIVTRDEQIAAYPVAMLEA